MEMAEFATRHPLLFTEGVRKATNIPRSVTDLVHVIGRFFDKRLPSLNQLFCEEALFIKVSSEYLQDSCSMYAESGVEQCVFWEYIYLRVTLKRWYNCILGLDLRELVLSF